MERIDDLQTNGLKLIQDDEYFCFGSDAVALANFVSGRAKDSAIDLGAGSGIITVLLAGKKGIKTTAVEIDKNQAELARRNIEINNLGLLADVINAPMQNLRAALEAGSRTIVVTNPPYFKVESGFLRKGNPESACHETHVTQREVVDIAAYLLSTGGRFYIVYPIQRMAELMSTCREFRLEPKELVFLNKQTFMLKCIKDAQVGLKICCI